MPHSLVSLTFNPAELLRENDPQGKLQAYFNILRKENQKVNLVSRETIDTGLEALAAESLLPLEKIESAGFDSYLDIGSGGGFPAIPLILTKKINDATLFERTSKKSLALQRIMAALSLDKDRFRVEQSDFGQQLVPDEFDLITLRLVKLTPKLLRGVRVALRTGGHFIYYSGAPENLSVSGFSCLTYCYRAGNDSLEKLFTIFKKN